MTNTSVSNVGVFLAASQESAYFRGWTDALLTAYEEVRTMETCSGITAVEVRKDALKAIDVCKGWWSGVDVTDPEEHLPECPLSRPRDFDCGCVCHLLRACEQRVLSLNPVGLGVLIAQRAREHALDAAREAVEAVENDPDAEVDYDRDYAADPTGNCRNPRIWLRSALAAIDALRQERSGNPDTPLSAENEDPPLVCGECGTEIALYDVGCLHLADNDDFGHIGTIAAIDALKEKP